MAMAACAAGVARGWNRGVQVDTRASGRIEDFMSAAEATLTHLRRRTGLGSWLVCRRDGDDGVMLVVRDSKGSVEAGAVVPWAGSVWAAMVANEELRAVADARSVPQLSTLWAPGPVAGCLTEPFYNGEGSVSGVLFGWSEAPQPVVACHAGLVGLHAALLGTVLHHELRIAAESRRAQQAEHAAGVDVLTGLSSRRGWDGAIEAEEARARRYGSAVSVLIFDLDELKAVNDAWGHDAGDRLLRRAATVLQAATRQGDLVARLGGDEFGVILPETDASGAALTADRLRQTLDDAGVLTSIGWAARRTATGLAQAWRDADTAMYEDKRTRRAQRVLPVAVTAPRLLSAIPDGPARQAEPTGPHNIEALLRLAREQLDLDTAAATSLDGRQLVVRNIDSRNATGWLLGQSAGAQETYCHAVLDGTAAAVLPDTARLHSAQSCLPDAVVGAHVAVPLTGADGTVRGTLCVTGSRPAPHLRPHEAESLRALAVLVTQLLEQQERWDGQRQSVLRSLDELYAAGGPDMVFQPIVELKLGDAVGFEALSRFPSGAAGEWFAAARTAGVGTELELAALRSALRSSGHVEGYLSVNLSARSLCAPEFLEIMDGADLHRVVLEISELEDIPSYPAVNRILVPMRRSGLRVAVDDAGARGSSMRHVLALLPDLIKLDSTLVRDIAEDPFRQALASSLTAFARSIDASVIAKSVESDEETDVLRDLGVQFAQGHLFARPSGLLVPVDPATVDQLRAS